MAFFSEGYTKSKLMVLYFLNELSVDLTKEQIATFSAAYELIPYFELQSAIYELEEEGFLAAVPRPYGQAYCLTPKGKETLGMFVERLPQSVLKKVRYRYALLQGMPEGGLMGEYPLLHLRTIVKRRIKRWLVRK